MIFFQCYPRFTRFECKAFLSAALSYFGGAAANCMVDNSNVVVAQGSGASMIPAPEMAAFAERYGFVFIAHEKGDANRSARVEAGRAAPVLCDVTEHSMLDLVPFTGPGGKWRTWIGIPNCTAKSCRATFHK